MQRCQSTNYTSPTLTLECLNWGLAIASVSLRANIRLFCCQICFVYIYLFWQQLLYLIDCLPLPLHSTQEFLQNSTTRHGREHLKDTAMLKTNFWTNVIFKYQLIKEETVGKRGNLHVSEQALVIFRWTSHLRFSVSTNLFEAKWDSTIHACTPHH